MPLDLSNWVTPENKFEGLNMAAATAERSNERAQSLKLQQEAKKNASATFLTNVLDKKDYLSGTPQDPNINEGLTQVMQQGMALAAKGVDNATLYQALAPAINKISTYSTNAKLANQNIKDGLGKLKAYPGYNQEALEEEAKNAAFFDTDPTTGKRTLKSPDKIDPNGNWIGQAIQNAPDKVTTSAGLDAFADKAPLNKTLSDVTQYTPTGGMTKNKVHLIGQDFLVPDVDEKGVTTGLVPKYEIAHDGGKPLMHTFTDAKGNQSQAPVRVLDEGTFDNMLQRDPSIADHIKGLVQQHIGEYKDENGQPLDIGSPRAKLVARALAYDELNRRKKSSIEQAQIDNKPSAAQVHVNLYGDKETEYRNRERGIREGTQDVLGTEQQRAEDRARGGVIGRQSVLGNDSTQAADKAKGTAAGKAAAAAGITPSADPVSRFEKNGDPNSLKSLSGTTTKEGKKIETIAKTSSMNWVNDYYIKFADGTEQKFKNKAALSEYLKNNAPAATPPSTAPASSTPISTLRTKYKY